MNDATYMQMAIDITRKGIAAGQSPFGAVIVRDGIVAAAAHNTVWLSGDPTAHAEVNAIRQAASALHAIDLSGCTLYSSCEPCPMCLSACHWAKIDRVVYGATIADAADAGFSELRVDAKILAQMGGSPMRVEVGPLRQECRDLFAEWKNSGLARAY